MVSAFIFPDFTTAKPSVLPGTRRVKSFSNNVVTLPSVLSILSVSPYSIKKLKKADIS